MTEIFRGGLSNTAVPPQLNEGFSRNRPASSSILLEEVCMKQADYFFGSALSARIQSARYSNSCPKTPSDACAFAFSTEVAMFCVVEAHIAL